MSMEMIPEILQSVFTIQNLIFMNVGMFIGVIFGAVPGLNGNLAITVFLPFTFTLDGVAALLMLCSIYFGSMFGGSITAILINTPGTGAAACTLLDGHPMAQKGQPRRALDTALIASTVGGIISALCLLLFAPQLGRMAMNFGSPEYFVLALFGLSVIATVSGDNMIKGLIASGIGMLLGCVGTDSISGVRRFTFGNKSLYGGLKTMAVMLGLFAMAQILTRIRNAGAGKVKKQDIQELNKAAENDRYTLADFKNTIVTMIKSSFLGAVIGAIPGIGGGIAGYMSYNEAKRCAKPGEKFGEGAINGIAAPESANNGSSAAALIPMLTLGIPGSAIAATLMGAFQMHGLTSGPKLFEENTLAVYTILVGCLVAQICMLLQGKYLMRLFVKITRIPFELLTACLMVLCCAGAYAVANTAFNVQVMLIIGIAAYFIRMIGFPHVPMILGLLLGPTAEFYLRNSLSVGNGSWMIFLKRPICIAFMVLLVVLLVMLKRPNKDGKTLADG